MALLWSSPALFSIAILSPCPPPSTGPRNAPHQPQRTNHLVHCSIPANPPAPCPWAKRLSGPPKLTYRHDPKAAPPPSPPSTTPPAPTATATVHSRPPQSVPSQPVTPQFPSSSIASPTRPETIPACRPSPAADSAHFAPLRRSQASHRADSGSLSLPQSRSLSSTVHRPPPLIRRHSPTSPPTADYSNVHDPDNADHNNNTRKNPSSIHISSSQWRGKWCSTSWWCWVMAAWARRP